VAFDRYTVIERIDLFDKPKRKPKPAKAHSMAQRRRQRKHAKTICESAITAVSWDIADRFAKAMVGCRCAELGVAAPKSIIEQAITDDDREWLQVRAPDVLEDIDEDVQERLANALDWWGTPD
jgi:hypothetical protein